MRREDTLSNSRTSRTLHRVVGHVRVCDRVRTFAGRGMVSLTRIHSHCTFGEGVVHGHTPTNFGRAVRDLAERSL